MQITHYEISPDAAVVDVGGKVMLGPESEQISDTTSKLLSEGKRRIIFNIAGVTSIDSTGIGRFISSYNKIAAAGGEMRIAGASGYLLQAFHVTRLDTVFRFYPSVEEACKKG